jgi:Zn-dependent M32 family carboxypeptidase
LWHRRKTNPTLLDLSIILKTFKEKLVLLIQSIEDKLRVSIPRFSELPENQQSRIIHYFSTFGLDPKWSKKSVKIIEGGYYPTMSLAKCWAAEAWGEMRATVLKMDDGAAQDELRKTVNYLME